MTFSCKHHDFETDKCRKLKTDCIMARPGCVLEGRVTITEESARRIEKLKNEAEARRKRRK
jgi:hypothetical protein